MANFAAISDIEAFLQLTIAGDAVKVAAANRALEEATAAIRNYCNQYIEAVSNESVDFDISAGQRKIFLPELPVNSISSVVENSETLADGTDFELGSYGILWRISNSVPVIWYVGRQIVTVVYSHGYNTIPDDVKAVCTRAASRSYQAGLLASSTAGVPGIASKSLGDFSVSYQSAAGGGVGQGLMGASGFRPLLLSEKDLLNKYRYKLP